MRFDEAYWAEVIKRPEWYMEFQKFAEEHKFKNESETDDHDEFKKQVRHFFEAVLEKSQVNLGSSGENFDKDRQPVDTVVIHHTSSQPGYKLSYLNAVQLLNIYVPVFAKNNGGKPIWSGHFYKGKQVFWGYHWLMRMDGSLERLLDDDKIGWQAGDWDINTRSIGICLDNNYENQGPDDEVLRKLAGFIRQNYPGKKVIGHREARQGTICPGGNFLDGWKKNLLSYIHD